MHNNVVWTVQRRVDQLSGDDVIVFPALDYGVIRYKVEFRAEIKYDSAKVLVRRGSLMETFEESEVKILHFRSMDYVQVEFDPSVS